MDIFIVHLVRIIVLFTMIATYERQLRVRSNKYLILLFSRQNLKIYFKNFLDWLTVEMELICSERLDTCPQNESLNGYKEGRSFS